MMYVICTAQDIYGEKCSCKRNAQYYLVGIYLNYSMTFSAEIY